MHRRRISTRGFSLMEMLVYVTLLSVLASIVVTTVLSLSDLFYRVRAIRAVEANASAALERAMRDIRDYDTVITAESALGVHPGRLTLSRTLPMGGTEKLEFYLDGSSLHLRQDGIELGALTAPPVSVESFIVTEASNGASRGVRVELALKGSVGSVSIAAPFDLFAVLRGSY